MLPLNRCQALYAGDKWPARSGEQATWEGADLLFIGFQEITELNALNVVSGGTHDNAKAWGSAIGCALNRLPLPASYLAARAEAQVRPRSSLASNSESPTTRSNEVRIGVL